MKSFYVLILLAAISWGQKPTTSANSLSVSEPVGPNGPFMVSVKSQGQYSASKTYEIFDLVGYKGEHYVSMAGLNQGNTPGWASSLWLMIPNDEHSSLASWGTAAVGEPVTLHPKHFMSATSYVCAVTHELLAPPPQAETPPPDNQPGRRPGRPQSPPPSTPHKAKITYRDGSHFTIADEPVPHVGFICAGN